MKDIEKFEDALDNAADNVDEEELEDDIITLVDDEGNECDFELLDIIEYKDGEYAVMCSVDDGEEASEAAILRIIDNEEDPDSPDFITPDTDEEITAVYELFKEKYKDVIDFED